MNLTEIIERLSAIDTEVREAQDVEIVNKLGEEKKELLERKGELEELETRKKNALDISSGIVEPKTVERVVTEARKESIEEVEARSFMNYIKRECNIPIEYRAGEENFDMTNNGAIIPATIANKIISSVKELSPIFAKSTIFNVKGTLKVPVYGLANTTHDIAVGYQTEFTDITADAGAFTSIDLTGFLAGALTLVGKSVINNSGLDVVSFVIEEMSKKIAIFLEKELLNGTADKVDGALSTSTTLLAGSTSAISADNLIDLQAKIPTVYQKDAFWIMNPETFTGLKKLKDGNGQYLLQSNFSQDFPYAILGKPVYVSDNMPEIASAAKAVLYGDMSGLGVNMRENIEIQILNEKYATQHAIGIVSWFEFDSGVIDNQKLATLVMSVS